jgi:uncharacterized protein with PIN domain
MAKSTISTAAADPVRPLVERVAKEVIDRIYGPRGPAWGTRLTDIEDTVLAVRQVLAETMLDEALQRQAKTAPDRPTPFHRCPKCGQDVVPEDEGEPRIMITRAGEAEWSEPETYCRRCRRAFFPSEQKLGD